MAEAGALLRTARRRAGLSQVELARRAGVTQSVISAYESGARQPSLPTLERLVSASGFRLELLLRSDDFTRERSLLDRLLDQRDRVIEIAAEHGLTNVRVFGSVARNQARADSDIDLLVDVAPGVGLFEFGRCQSELELLLGVPIDLVPAAGLKAHVAAEVLEEATPL